MVAKILILDSNNELGHAGYALGGRMKRTLFLVAIVALFACAPLPMRANTINYNYSFSLGGNAGSVTGSFAYNATNYAFSNTSITFNSSIYGNVTLTNLNVQKGNLYVYGGKVGNDYILYSILINPKDPSQYTVSGTIVNMKTGKMSGFSNNFNMSAPEGGDWYVYALASALVLLGGISLARQQRRKAVRVAFSRA